MRIFSKFYSYFRAPSVCIWIVSFVFVISAMYGYIDARMHPEEAMMSFRDMSQGFEFIKNLNTLEIFLFIFLNNSIKTFLVVVLGFLFGIAPLLFIVTNGTMLGLVVAAADSRISFLFVVLSIVPHGILEIPAVLIASGYGLWLGYRFYRTLAFGEPFREYFSFAMRRYFSLVLPVLLGAAFIEAFITPKVIEFIR